MQEVREGGEQVLRIDDPEGIVPGASSPAADEPLRRTSEKVAEAWHRRRERPHLEGLERLACRRFDIRKIVSRCRFAEAVLGIAEAVLALVSPGEVAGELKRNRLELLEFVAELRRRIDAAEETRDRVVVDVRG